VPPLTVIGPLLNATPTSPAETDAQLTVSAVLIVIEQPALVAPRASFTCTEKLPAAVGVPVTAPVVVLRARPAGSVPTTRRYKEPCRRSPSSGRC
jgi:hypothetical protein